MLLEEQQTVVPARAMPGASAVAASRSANLLVPVLPMAAASVRIGVVVDTLVTLERVSNG